MVDNNSREIFYWIVGVINSCINQDQLINAEKLIYLFDRKYNDQYLFNMLYEQFDIHKLLI